MGHESLAVDNNWRTPRHKGRSRPAVIIRQIRLEEVVITRIGHRALTHSWLFTEEWVQPHCGMCDCSLTVNHLLTEIPKYQDCRKQFQLTGDLVQILGKDPGSVMQQYIFSLVWPIAFDIVLFKNYSNALIVFTKVHQ
jgi:hypothetical protein